MSELYILFAFMIAAAIAAIEMKDLLSSVVCVSAVGLGLAVSFLVLKAPDMAFTQLIVEILCLIILIRATIKKDLPFSASGRWILNTGIMVLFTFVFLGAASYALREIPEFGFPLMRTGSIYLRDGFAQTGATNLVAAILQDYRAYDRLGEVTVLFVAYIGTLAILRPHGKVPDAGEAEHAEDALGTGTEPRMSVIVRTIARLVARVILIFGLYVILHGQVTHGGGFAGGVVMALVFILLMLAFGKDFALQLFPRRTALLIADAGVLLLMVLALIGYQRGYFFSNFMGQGWPFELWSAGVIPFLNVAIGLVVVGSLYGIFAALSLFRPKGEKRP